MTIITSPTSQTTAQTIINGALRLLQVASTDVVLTADEASDALESLNQMIDGWSNESLMLYHVQREQFTCVPTRNPHTIGLGGDFNTTVPIHVEAATVTVGGVDYPIIPVQYDDYAVIKLKTKIAVTFLPRTFVNTAIEAALVAGPAARKTKATPGEKPFIIILSAIGIEAVAQTYIGTPISIVTIIPIMPLLMNDPEKKLSGTK